MYYLKRIVVILENAEAALLFAGIGNEARDCGIEFFMLEESGSFIPPFGMQEAGMEEACHVREETARDEEDKILWITDSVNIAEYLSANSLKTLIYLHKGDYGAAFGKALYAFEKPQEITLHYLDRIYRRYAGIPWDILDTDRCIIRESSEQDVDAFYAIYAEPSITKYMEGLYEAYDEEKAYIHNYIEKIYKFYEFGVWSVIEKESGEVIGRAGLSYREGFDEPELGFVIGTPWQRRGYAYEVCRAILNYGSEEFGFSKILAFAEPENTPSLRLCDKLGFKSDGITNISGINYVKMSIDTNGL
ncbi:MAG: GNAT family N-acetyltransferase [Lachnospiraceae bacterium]|nr:GNAT family N-acetyltransferase [Lachnospiraceae bacterium]